MNLFDPGVSLLLAGSGIDSPINAITLDNTLHRRFGDLTWYLEPVQVSPIPSPYFTALPLTTTAEESRPHLHHPVYSTSSYSASPAASKHDYHLQRCTRYYPAPGAAPTGYPPCVLQDFEYEWRWGMCGSGVAGCGGYG